MNILLSKKGKTGRLLAESIGLPLCNHTIPLNTTFIIRWGNTLPSDLPCLNSAQAIVRASDKTNCRRLLLENDLPIPGFSTTDFPIVGRTAHHTQGRGFWLIENERGLEFAKSRGAKYFSIYYPKQNEYRVHIGSGKVLLFSIKEGDKNKIIWNKRKSNFTFRHIRRSEWLESEKLMAIQRVVKKAIKIIGLDFGAVDVMADAIGDYLPFVISEINTAPSLSPLAIQKYTSYFQAKISGYLTISI